MCPKIVWVSWITWTSVLKFQPHSSYYNHRTTRNHMARGPGCTVNASSLQCCGTQAILAQTAICDWALSWWRIHCQRSSGHFYRIWSRSLPVPSCNTPYLSTFLEGRHTDRPSLGNRRKWPTSLYLLTFANEPFHRGFATMELPLWLTFCFRIIMMNPRFINIDDTRKSGSWKICARLSKHTEQWCSISLTQRKWGTHIEQMRFILSSFVKMCWIDIFETCWSSAGFRMDEWQSSSITTDYVLMLTSLTTV